MVQTCLLYRHALVTRHEATTALSLLRDCGCTYKFCSLHKGKFVQGNM